jgi:hypothetical protein
MRKKRVTSLRDEDDNPFHFNILPTDPIFPHNRRPPSRETQQEALDDITRQLIVYLTVAIKDKTNPLRPVQILAACERVLEPIPPKASIGSESFITTCKPTCVKHSGWPDAISCGQCSCANTMNIPPTCRRCETLVGAPATLRH